MDRDRHPGRADPNPADPNRYEFQANEKDGKVNFFPIFQYAVKNTEKISTFDTDEKVKCKVSMLLLKVKNSDFPTCVLCKTGGRPLF
jgi:hypothetical protein